MVALIAFGIPFVITIQNIRQQNHQMQMDLARQGVENEKEKRQTAEQNLRTEKLQIEASKIETARSQFELDKLRVQNDFQIRAERTRATAEDIKTFGNVMSKLLARDTFEGREAEMLLLYQYAAAQRQPTVAEVAKNALQQTAVNTHSESEMVLAISLLERMGPSAIPQLVAINSSLADRFEGQLLKDFWHYVDEEGFDLPEIEDTNTFPAEYEAGFLPSCTGAGSGRDGNHFWQILL